MNRCRCKKIDIFEENKIIGFFQFFQNLILYSRWPNLLRCKFLLATHGFKKYLTSFLCFFGDLVLNGPAIKDKCFQLFVFSWAFVVRNENTFSDPNLRMTRFFYTPKLHPFNFLKEFFVIAQQVNQLSKSSVSAFNAPVIEATEYRI